MSKHTKGPWVVDEMTSISPADDLSLEIASVQNIDNVSGKWMFLEESQANARLIAAAPELLEVAEAVMAWWEIEQYATSGDRNIYDYDPDLVIKARSAIAKTRGEA